MWKKEYKKCLLVMAVLVVCCFPSMSVLGRGKGGGGGGGGSAGGSTGRSQSAPQMSQSNASRGSSDAAMSSRPSAAPVSAPAANRSSVSSASQPRVTSQPRSFENRSAVPQRAAQPTISQPSRSVSSPVTASAPATNKSVNNSSRGRAVSSRPVQRTVEVTGTAQLNRASSGAAQNSASSDAVAVSNRSNRAAASAAAATARPKITAASVSQKIEPSVSRSVSKKAERSSSAVKEAVVQSSRGNGQAAKASSQRVKDSSLTAIAAPETGKELREKAMTAEKYVQKIGRSRKTTQKTITADKTIENIRTDRSGKGKTDSSAKTVASVADTTTNTSVPSLADGIRREGRDKREGGEDRGGREGSRPQPGDSSREVTGVTETNRDTARVRQPGMEAERDGARDRQRQPRIEINNTNKVVVQGDVTRDRARPRMPRDLRPDAGHVEHDSHWQRHDCHDDGHHDHHDGHSSFYFSFAWSNFSCGNVAYFPYSYYHSWCHYPAGYYGFSYYYPGYHRRFIFVSLGGYWPEDYHYYRYYWYGCHPYYWYGPDIVYYPSGGNTYNTYNYYNTTAPAAEPAATPYYELGNPKPTEETQPVDTPEYQSPADLCFENAVDLFMAGNYKDAVAQLREAVTLSPEDVVLPFTYAQALFANGEYALAAGVLRAAVARIPEDELTIYYPRGLYKDEKVLNEQIAQLEAAVAKEPFSADYKLLLGYQYMGIGDLNKAHGPLTEAAKEAANQPTVAKLLELADKLEAEPETTAPVK